MKRDDEFLKRLNGELQKAELPMSEKLKNEPLCADASPQAVVAERKIPRARWFAWGAGALAACVATCVVLPFLPKTERGACMYLNVNPSVALLLNGEMQVEKVVSENADGDAVLSDGAFVASLTGATAERAAELLAEKTAQMGFFDLYNAGDDGYNEMTVSFSSAVKVSEEKLRSVQSTLTEFFKGNGVYVYVSVENETVRDYARMAETLRQRSVAWYETVENKRAGAVETMFDFAWDILRDGFGRYDLYLEIVGADETARQPLLEKMYYTYGVDYRDYDWADRLEMELYGANAGAYAEELRPYLSTGFSEDILGDFTEKFSAFALFAAANGYGDELTGAIQTAILAAIDEFFGAAHDYVSEMQTLWQEYSATLNTKYKALFDESRNTISDTDYQSFLQKIGKI